MVNCYKRNAIKLKVYNIILLHPLYEFMVKCTMRSASLEQISLSSDDSMSGTSQQYYTSIFISTLPWVICNSRLSLASAGCHSYSLATEPRKTRCEIS